MMDMCNERSQVDMVMGANCIAHDHIQAYRPYARSTVRYARLQSRSLPLTSLQGKKRGSGKHPLHSSHTIEWTSPFCRP